MTSAIIDLSAMELVAGYRSGELSPVEATEAALARIEEVNPTLNAFLLIDADSAMESARAAEQRWHAGQPRGALDGVPTSIKDICLTRGWPTLRGSKTVDPDQAWDTDSPFVARLREAGAVFPGKTTTPEFGWKGVTDSPVSGITRNPWDPEKTPGGSSGGAAGAVVTGMSALSHGSDAGGSIRIPASFSGCYGIKATFGRVPSWPASPFGTLANHGPMSRTVKDAALMLTVMAQPDARDPYALAYDGIDFLDGIDAGVSGLRIAYSPTLGGHVVDGEVARLVADAVAKLEDLGARVEESDPPLPPDRCREVFDAHWKVYTAAFLRSLGDVDRSVMDPGLVQIAEQGEGFDLWTFIAMQKQREALTTAMREFHQSYDLLVTPMMPIPAFGAGRLLPEDWDDETDWIGWSPFSYPFNMTRQPAASLNVGWTAAGLPVGLQIVGPLYEEKKVLRASKALEDAVDAAYAPSEVLP